MKIHYSGFGIAKLVVWVVAIIGWVAFMVWSPPLTTAKPYYPFSVYQYSGSCVFVSLDGGIFVVPDRGDTCPNAVRLD